MKYALPDLERRWLVRTEHAMALAAATDARLLEDRYLAGTRLRLRRVTSPEGAITHKLTRKYAPVAATATTAATPHASTNIYLAEAEYALLATLPGWPLRKHRQVRDHAGLRFAIDVFTGELRGLVLTEVELPDPLALAAVAPPPWAGAEVSDDPAFTGAALARTTAAALARLLAT